MKKSSTTLREKTVKDIKLEHVKKHSKSEIQSLQTRYKFHLDRTRKGFLTTNVLERLLHIKNWPEAITADEAYTFYYDIREHARAAIDDFRLLSEILTEAQFKKVFGERIEGEVIIEERNNQKYTTKGEPRYPISLFFETLVPITSQLKEGRVVTEIQKQQEWRKEVLEEIAIKALYWYLNSGLLSTDVHRRLVVDTIDAIGVMSSGKKPWFFRPDNPMQSALL